MSGTSTLLGLALAHGEGGRAADLALVVGLFAAGAGLGAAAGLLAGQWRSAVVLCLVAGKVLPGLPLAALAGAIAAWCGR